MVQPADRNLLIKASTVQGFLKGSIEKNWRRRLEIRKICEDEGFQDGLRSRFTTSAIVFASMGGTALPT